MLNMPTDLHAIPKPTQFELDSPRAPRRRGITRLTVDVPSYDAPPNAKARPSPRWRTPEFMVYAVVFAAALPVMVWIPVALSSSTSRVVLSSLVS